VIDMITEKQRAYNKQYYLKNKEKMEEQFKEYRRKNAKVILQRTIDWKKENRESKRMEQKKLQGK